MYTPGYKIKDKENLSVEIFPAGTCRRQRLGAEVGGRAPWPGLKTSENHAKTSKPLVSFKMMRI